MGPLRPGRRAVANQSEDRTGTAPSSVVDAHASTAARRLRLSLWLLRAVITVHLVSALAQPVLAGRFLSGDIDAIDLHGNNGIIVLTATELVMILAALVYVVFGRGRMWILLAALVLFPITTIQGGLGFSRTLQIHIPLGVAIVTASVLLAMWVWSPSAARPRSTR